MNAMRQEFVTILRAAITAAAMRDMMEMDTIALVVIYTLFVQAK